MGLRGRPGATPLRFDVLRKRTVYFDAARRELSDAVSIILWLPVVLRLQSSGRDRPRATVTTDDTLCCLLVASHGAWVGEIKISSNSLANR